jgi:hypothetical protein
MQCCYFRTSVTGSLLYLIISYCPVLSLLDILEFTTSFSCQCDLQSDRFRILGYFYSGFHNWAFPLDIIWVKLAVDVDEP